MQTLDGASARPSIEATRSEIAPDCVFGDDVRIEAEEVVIGPGCKIGFSGDDDFRTYGGVRIKARRLELGEGVTLGRALRIDGGDITFDEGVRVNRFTTIRVLDTLHIGAYGSIGEYNEIMGRDVRIGQELWTLSYVKIGGGSAFELESQLIAGHYLHLGMHVLINTARPVHIGNEVGLGTRTAIYTHGAYPSRLMGFPVTFKGVEIGDYTWVPGAVINPGVRIGSNCVIGVNSLVRRDIPDGSLAEGAPAKIVRQNCYPSPLTPAAQLEFFEDFLTHYARILEIDAKPHRSNDPAAVLLEGHAALYAASPEINDALLERLPTKSRVFIIGAPAAHANQLPEEWTIFDTRTKRIRGAADGASGRLINELRRYGIRFYSRPRGNSYIDWA